MLETDTVDLKQKAVMTTRRLIDTDAASERYRARSIDLGRKRLLITNLRGSEEEADLTVPPNCHGFGRIRHFRRATSTGWPPNPLPLVPACKALGIPTSEVLRAQAFQSAACNWRCWYCYVPFGLLAASRRYSDWFTPDQLVNLYLAEPDPPLLIDLTGGQPDLVPEWVPWMMAALRERGLDHNTYLWSDDNLSTDYLWRYLSLPDLDLMASYRNYGKVGCFKGFDAHSFSFNTRTHPALFDRQFELMDRLIDLGLDIYAYATFTTPARPEGDIRTGVTRFVDRLQGIDPNLPLRTVPLEVAVYTPVQPRLHEEQVEAMAFQRIAVVAWNEELQSRFTDSERDRPISDVSLRHR